MENLMRTATSTVGAGLLVACAAQAQDQRPPMVCDPLPPARMSCDTGQLILRGCIKPSAEWVRSGGRWSLRLALSSPGPSPVEFAGSIWEAAGGKSAQWEIERDDTKVSGASLQELEVRPKDVVFVLVPARRAKQAVLEFPVLFNYKKLALKLSLDIGAPPSDKGSVPVKQVN
jgi:hypothetical protein